MRNRLNTIELLMVATSEDPLLKQSDPSLGEKDMSRLLLDWASPSRICRPLLRARRKIRQLLRASAVAFRSLLLLCACWVASVVQRVVNGLMGKARGVAGAACTRSGGQRGEYSAVGRLFYPENDQGATGAAGGHTGRKGVGLFFFPSPSPDGEELSLASSLEAGYGDGKPRRETSERYHHHCECDHHHGQEQHKYRQEVDERTLGLALTPSKGSQQQRQHRDKELVGGNHSGINDSFVDVAPEHDRSYDFGGAGDGDSSPGSTIASDDGTAPASPVETANNRHAGNMAAATAVVPDEAYETTGKTCAPLESLAAAAGETAEPAAQNATVAATEAALFLSPVGGEDGCCGLCGHTLEAGETVVRSPGCTLGLMLHRSCFEESDVVFSDDSDNGRLKFGCDCGQFHSGVGLTQGVYAFSSEKSASQPSSSECSASATSPGAASPEGAEEWGEMVTGARAMRSPRQRIMLREEKAASALRSCPLFFQVDPSALAIVDGTVELRPVGEEKECKSEAAESATAPPASSFSQRHRFLEPDRLSERFSRQDVLSRAEATELLRQGTATLDKEDNVLELQGETVVVGDLHGQFFDLLNLLRTNGKPPEKQYLFLGDYVDRGSFSSEVALYLIALKVAFPQRVHLIRGNHETANQTASCGFKNECFSKYGPQIYDKFLECFSALPVCAILSQEGLRKSLFCVHGGISPRLKTVADIRDLERRVEPEDGTLLADLLWSDPSDDPSLVLRRDLQRRANDETSASTRASTRPTSTPTTMASCGDSGVEPEGLQQHKTEDNDDGHVDFAPNLVRGCSWSYGRKAAEAFLEENGFRGILRAHSVQGEGFHHHFQGGDQPKSSIGEGVSTVFSAPMYTTHANRGGVLVVRGDGRVDPVGYDAAPEPPTINSAQAAVRRVCPYMPASLSDWLRLENAQRQQESQEQKREQEEEQEQGSSGVFDDGEALALRVLWESMSGGGSTVTVDSLFAFDDSFGDGVDCLHAAAALRVLVPPEDGDGDDGEGGVCSVDHGSGGATMTDFLRVAEALKKRNPPFSFLS